MKKKKTKLYVFIGASCAGKSELAKEIIRCNPNDFELVVKATTRTTRNEPQPDNVYNQDLEDIRDNNTYNIYFSNGNTAYGVDRKKIEKKLATGKSLILVVNDELTAECLRRYFPGQVTTVFIHRDLTTEMMESIFRKRGTSEAEIKTATLKREITRNILYERLAGGLLVPDYTIINYGDSLDPAVNQFLLITKERSRIKKQKQQIGLFQIILAGTGPFKDDVLRMHETVPDGGKCVVPKYLSRERRKEDGVETINKPAPSTALKYQFFGNDYAIDAEDILRRLREYGYAVCTIADINTATTLKKIVTEQGFGCQLTYLHQPFPDMSIFPLEEKDTRAAHYWQLLELYTKELIRHSEPLIPISSKTELSRWAQRQLLRYTNF